MDLHVTDELFPRSVKTIEEIDSVSSWNYIIPSPAGFNSESKTPRDQLSRKYIFLVLQVIFLFLYFITGLYFDPC